MGKVVYMLAGLTVWADTYSRQAGVDAEHYAFRITLSDLTNELRGEARVDFRVQGASRLYLDFAAG